MWLNSLGGALLAELEHDLLGLVDEHRRVAGPLPAEPGDLAAGADEAAEDRRLVDDLRVVARVRARGDEGRQLVDAVARRRSPRGRRARPARPRA